ncbi:MAG: sulfurtransferase-like selenium metabolism protein YedF [Synergistaceae bacterium]|jgi:selenium metabolism protein YedF|nr:sulfurtransferase-like selenium metabolism protein YedF [Synergistaceae bacterium]
MKTIDMRGQPCPIPVINAKKILAEPGVDGVAVLVDNIVAVQNLEKMAKGTGCEFSYSEEKPSSYRVAITGSVPAGVPSERTCVAPEPMPSGLVVLITSDHMGEGSEELGKLLIKGFIFSLTQLDPLPEAVIFLNGGAYLTADGANTVPDLLALQERGTAIFTCGTCANYYKLTESLAVGSIADMMGIVGRLAVTGRIITL